MKGTRTYWVFGEKVRNNRFFPVCVEFWECHGVQLVENFKIGLTCEKLSKIFRSLWEFFNIRQYEGNKDIIGFWRKSLHYCCIRLLLHYKLVAETAGAAWNIHSQPQLQHYTCYKLCSQDFFHKINPPVMGSCLSSKLLPNISCINKPNYFFFTNIPNWHNVLLQIKTTAERVLLECVNFLHWNFWTISKKCWEGDRSGYTQRIILNKWAA